MMRQPSLFPLQPIDSDVVYTPDIVAMDIVEWLSPSGKCLDPCLGEGAFYRQLPPGSEWCELKHGRDFFAFDKKVDWIIGNPPYSIFDEWLQHSFDIGSDVAYILPTNKVFQRVAIMEMVNEWGGIAGLRVYGGGLPRWLPVWFLCWLLLV